MAVYEHKAPSDHIRFAAFTHGAYEKGDYVSVGALTGIADISYEANAAVALDIGVARAVFRVGAAEVAGTPAVGANLYFNSGAFTTVSGGKLCGVITDITGAVAFVKIGD